MKQELRLVILICVISNSLENTHKTSDERHKATKLESHSNFEQSVQTDKNSINSSKNIQSHGRYDVSIQKRDEHKPTLLNNQNQSINHNDSLKNKKPNYENNINNNLSYIKQKTLKYYGKNGSSNTNNNHGTINIDNNVDKQKKYEHHESKQQNQISHGNVHGQGVNNKETIQNRDKKSAKPQSLNVTIAHEKEKSVRRDSKSIKKILLKKSPKGKENEDNKNKQKIKRTKTTKQNNKGLKQTKKQKLIQRGQNKSNKTSKPNVRRRRVKILKNLSKTGSQNYGKQLTARKYYPYGKKRTRKYMKEVTDINNHYKKMINPNIAQTKKADTENTEAVIYQIKTLNTKQPRHQNSSKVVIEHEFPYMAAVIKGHEFLCAGAIIDEQWILTAADKLYSVQGSMFFLRVRLGSINRKKGGKLLSIKQLLIHPYYHNSKPTYDLALIKLSKPVTYSGTLRSVRLQLVPKEVTVTHFIVTSWAEKFVKNKRLPVIESILSVAHLHPSEPKECEEELNKISASSDGVMCLDTGVDDACRRDVGAPVVTNGLLWGLVSSWRPPSCDEEDKVTFFTTMSAKNITNWVHATIHGHTMDSVK